MLNVWTDRFRNTAYIDSDFWVYEIVCPAFL